jgi:hypothetical protein
MNLPASLRITIISQMCTRRGKTDIGKPYSVYLSDGRWWLQQEHSLWPDRELTFLEMWTMLKNENHYNLTRYGTAMRIDKRWETVHNKAEFDNIDKWDETGNMMREVKETLERLIKELELMK